MISRFIRISTSNLHRIQGLYRKSPRKFIILASLASGLLIFLLTAGGVAASRSEEIKVASKDPETAMKNVDKVLDSVEFFQGGFQVIPDSVSYGSPAIRQEPDLPITFIDNGETVKAAPYQFDQYQISRRVRPLTIDLSLGSDGVSLWPVKSSMADQEEEEKPHGYPYYNPYPPQWVYGGYPYPNNIPSANPSPGEETTPSPGTDPSETASSSSGVDNPVAISASPVPAPPALGMFAAGLSGLMAIRHRFGKRRKKSV